MLFTHLYGDLAVALSRDPEGFRGQSDMETDVKPPPLAYGTALDDTHLTWKSMSEMHGPGRDRDLFAEREGQNEVCGYHRKHTQHCIKVLPGT